MKQLVRGRGGGVTGTAYNSELPVCPIMRDHPCANLARSIVGFQTFSFCIPLGSWYHPILQSVPNSVSWPQGYGAVGGLSTTLCCLMDVDVIMLWYPCRFMC